MNTLYDVNNYHHHRGRMPVSAAWYDYQEALGFLFSCFDLSCDSRDKNEFSKEVQAYTESKSCVCC